MMTTQFSTADGQAPGGAPVVDRGVIGKDRDERGGERAAGDDGEEEIGELERRVVCVERRADAEGRGDHRIAEQPGDRGQRKRRRHNEHVAGDVAAGRL